MQIQIPVIASRFLKENGTTVLTAGGVVGTVLTAALSVRAGLKTSETLLEAQYDRTHDEHGDRIDDDEHPMRPMTKVEKAALVWPYFVPPVVMGSLTIGSIIMSHRMSAGKAAALAAAYGVSQKQLDEYKAKLSEKMTGPKAQQVQDELAKERADRSTESPSQVIILGDNVLCYDQPTDRYFQSSMEKIRTAENKANREILENGYLPTSEFYAWLGLDGTTWSDDVGWHKPFTLEYSTIPAKDGRPCLAIDFSRLPESEYVKDHSRYSP